MPTTSKWDPAFAQEMIGATILIEVSYMKADGDLDHRAQFFGEVIAAEPERGFLVRLGGTRQSEHCWVPPVKEGIRRADPGVYRLRRTGEEVVDPDYVTSWTVSAPRQ